MDTELWHCQEHFVAIINVRDFLSVNKTRTSNRDSLLAKEMDCGAVPQFPFPGNPEPVYTCGHTYCHE